VTFLRYVLGFFTKMAAATVFIFKMAYSTFGNVGIGQINLRRNLRLSTATPLRPFAKFLWPLKPSVV